MRGVKAGRPRDEAAHLRTMARRYPARDERLRGQQGGKKLGCSLTRTWSMVRRLSATRDGLTLPELAAEHRVSVHTIRRELLALLAAGLPVIHQRTATQSGVHRWRVGDLGLAGPQPAAVPVSVTAHVTYALRVFRALDRAGEAGRTLEELAAATGATAALVLTSLRVLQAGGFRVVGEWIDDPPGKRWRIVEWRKEAA